MVFGLRAVLCLVQHGLRCLQLPYRPAALAPALFQSAGPCTEPCHFGFAALPALPAHSFRRYEGGFFPLDLPIRNAHDLADAPFRPLSALLRIWTTHAAPPGFAGGAAPAAGEQQAQQQPAAAAARQQPAVENGPAAAAPAAELNLPDDLHPEEDVLSAALKQMEIRAEPEPLPAALAPAAAPAPAPAAAAAPARTDPVIDPALVKRSPSNKGLAALSAAAPQPAPAMPQQPQLQQQVPFGAAAAAPLGPAPALAAHAPSAGLEHYAPFLHHHQQHPQAPAHLGGHPLAQQGSGLLGHPLGLQGPEPAMLAQQHLAPQQQLPLAAQLQHAAPQTHLDAAPAPWGAPHLQHAMHQQPALHAPAPAMPAPPAPQQPVGMSLLDIQREEQQRAEQQRAEMARLAAAVTGPPAPHQQQQVAAKPAAPVQQHEEAPAPERARPETKAAPWVGAAAKPQAGKCAHPSSGWLGGCNGRQRTGTLLGKGPRRVCAVCWACSACTFVVQASTPASQSMRRSGAPALCKG